jgi:hypothetical protein
MSNGPLTIWVLIIVLVTVGSVLILRYTAKKNEEKRINSILICKNVWGEEVCRWLIDNKINLKDYRAQAIMAGFQQNGWDFDTCKALFAGEIALGMTDRMVRAFLGTPSSIDEKEVSEKGETFRYIYGAPQKGATYIWFKNGQVTKIKN